MFYEEHEEEEEFIATEDDSDFIEYYNHLGRKGDYGDNDFYSDDFRIYVDGLPWHNSKAMGAFHQDFHLSLRVQLLPRYPPFYEICDSHSSALVSLTCLE